MTVQGVLFSLDGALNKILFAWSYRPLSRQFRSANKKLSQAKRALDEALKLVKQRERLEARYDFKDPDRVPIRALKKWVRLSYNTSELSRRADQLEREALDEVIAALQG